MTNTKYDLESPAFRADPFPTYARMRADDPVYPRTLPPGQTVFNAGTAWYLTRYDDCRAALRDQRFAREFRRAVDPEALAGMAEMPEVMKIFSENMVNVDEPEHLKLRTLINKAFSPKIVESLRGHVETVVDELLDGVEEKHRAKGRVDLIEELAFPVPITVITKLLGLPRDDRPFLREISTIAPPASPDHFEPVARKIVAAQEYFTPVFEERRRSPGEDLVSALVNAEVDGERLEGRALLAMVMLLLVAGYTTTVHLIGNGVLALLRQPEALEDLRRRPEIVVPAVDELLRYDGPMETALMRWAAEDVELRGQKIGRGDLVMVVLSAANRDPERFAEPDRLDLERAENHHLAFGGGIHFCLGAHLARLEGQITIGKLAARFPDLRLAASEDELEWRFEPPMRGLVALPTTF